MNRMAEFSISTYTSINNVEGIYELLDKVRSYDLITKTAFQKYQSKSEKEEVLKEINNLLIQGKSFNKIVDFLLEKCQSNNIALYHLTNIRTKTVKKALKLFD